jgi:hypothetical protein
MDWGQLRNDKQKIAFGDLSASVELGSLASLVLGSALQYSQQMTFSSHTPQLNPRLS